MVEYSGGGLRIGGGGGGTDSNGGGLNDGARKKWTGRVGGSL